jgi:two-component system sensor histidine kinase GlrK
VQPAVAEAAEIPEIQFYEQYPGQDSAMKLSIFSRLTIGYLTVFVVIGAMNLYAFLKLDQANVETGRTIILDERLLDVRKKLADSILMQMGSEKKFLITKERIFRDRLETATKDFVQHLDEALAMTGSSKQRGYLSRVAGLFERYRSLVDSEGLSLKNRDVQAGLQEQQKGRLVDEILGELKGLEGATHEDIHWHLTRMTEAGNSARRLNVLIWVLAFCIMVGTAFVTTRSVTEPISVLMAKTREVSKGVFKGDLRIGSPPEVAQLAQSFNAMCEKLNAAEKMKSSFFSVMSHELRTPLTSIKEGIGLFQDGAGGSTTEKQKRLLDILSQETARMIGLVNSLLDLSKMQQGMMPYHFSDEHLQLLVERVMMETAPLAEAKRISFSTSFAQGVPSLKLDRERMLQALRNLIGNALKFSPDGGLIEIASNLTDNGVELSVRDTGPGIPKESLDTIFEEFRQLPGGHPEGVQGSGLGLAIVKEIVMAHGGKVWAESGPGSGSTLTFVLPSPHAS